MIPLVQSRYPLWEQKSIERGNPDHERVVHGLAETPHAWRAQLVTSVITAEPQAIAAAGDRARGATIYNPPPLPEPHRPLLHGPLPPHRPTPKWLPRWLKLVSLQG